jgi:hypothetical protein
MKRVLAGVTVLGALMALAGCPIYPSNSGGGSYQVCGADACFDCPDPTYSDACVYWSCNTSGDCPYGYSCGATYSSNQYSSNGGGLACLASGTEDASTSSSACNGGCPNGYICAIANGDAACIPIGTLPVNDAGAVVPVFDASTNYSDGAAWEDAPFDATAPVSDASADAGASDGSFADVVLLVDASGSETGVLSGLCNADSDCATAGIAGPGAKCIDGLCTSQSDLCSDGTQCLAAGSVCADGVCLPTCSTSVSCPAGYACNYPIGVCTGNQGACSATAPCDNGAVCVEGHCVGPCGTGDGQAQCGVGQVCVNGGCIPDQQAQFDCPNSIDGTACTLPAGGPGICLHGDCYSGCPDGGGCPSSSPVCKSVTDNRGAYNVCGTSTDLGDQCNPAVGAYCTGATCIDGYCVTQ